MYPRFIPLLFTVHRLRYAICVDKELKRQARYFNFLPLDFIIHTTSSCASYAKRNVSRLLIYYSSYNDTTTQWNLTYNAIQNASLMINNFFCIITLPYFDHVNSHKLRNDNVVVLKLLIMLMNKVLSEQCMWIVCTYVNIDNIIITWNRND